MLPLLFFCLFFFVYFGGAVADVDVLAPVNGYFAKKEYQD